MKPVWQKFQLRAGIGGGGRGKITLTPDLPFYPAGTVVTAKVTTESGDTLQGWIQDGSSDIVATDAEFTLTMSNHHAITAMIRRKN